MADRTPVEQRILAGEFGSPIEPGYRLEAPGETPASSQEAIRGLWQREGVLGPEEAERRLAEVKLVAVHETAGVVAVFTAYLGEVPQLGMELWYYRVFVAAGHRSGNLAQLISRMGCKRLGDAYVDGSDSRGSGTIMELENEGLKQRFNWGQWVLPPCTFIGTNEHGDHVYVDYFPGATVPVPGAGTPY
jgi:hypothetical protein